MTGMQDCISWLWLFLNMFLFTIWIINTGGQTSQRMLLRFFIILVICSLQVTSKTSVKFDEHSFSQFRRKYPLTLLLLNTTCPVLANSVDPDQLASEANWPGSALFVIKYNMNFYKKKPGSSNLIGWKLEVGVAS